MGFQCWIDEEELERLCALLDPTPVVDPEPEAGQPQLGGASKISLLGSESGGKNDGRDLRLHPLVDTGAGSTPGHKAIPPFAPPSGVGAHGKIENDPGATAALPFGERPATKRVVGLLEKFRERAKGTGLIPPERIASPHQEESVESFRSTGDRLRGRIEEFLRWAKGATGAVDAFLVDDEGNSMCDTMLRPELLCTASYLGDSGSMVSRQLLDSWQGSVQMRLDPERVLSIIRGETSYGVMFVGVIAPAPISGKMSGILAQSLVDSVNDSAAE